MRYFRIATEGKTIDGRVITAEHIKQMAANYDPNKYGARIWIEHMRSLVPDGAFKAMGDVTALKTEKNADGKLVLLAAIEPTAELVKMNQDKQKIYTSIEIDPNFTDSGEAYLVGLGVTDSPASTGTERLMFSAISQEKTHLFSAYDDADFEFDDTQTADKSNIFSRVKELLQKHDTAQNQKADSQFSAFYKDVAKSIEQVIEDYSKRDKARIEQYNALAQKHNALQTSFDELKQSLDRTPASDHDDYTTRPTADGSSANNPIETDC
ncbi:GPO family capsid scaffolding protein [Rappaport israeli]|uniref:GPO family capsid scaffolding protein n=1 Tax=Rappaport israeli TaxID=1839807 RepID=UPI00093062B7|nr:GPO family capsid scaffolding protein [Rappaport israeli]